MSNYVIVGGDLVNCDELMHYGVKGMKWGVRRARKQEARALRKATKKYGTSEYDEKMALYKTRKSIADKREREYNSAIADKAAKKAAKKAEKAKNKKPVSAKSVAIGATVAAGLMATVGRTLIGEAAWRGRGYGGYGAKAYVKGRNIAMGIASGFALTGGVAALRARSQSKAAKQQNNSR